jgi:hypothetical protein
MKRLAAEGVVEKRGSLTGKARAGRQKNKRGTIRDGAQLRLET